MISRPLTISLAKLHSPHVNQGTGITAVLFKCHSCKSTNQKQPLHDKNAIHYLRRGNEGDRRRLGGGAGEGDRRRLAGGGDGLLLLLLKR